MDIHDRIVQIIDAQCEGNVAAFERRLGLKRSQISALLKNKSKVGHTLIIAICESYPSYSSEWLLFGRQSPHQKYIAKIQNLKHLLDPL